MNVIANLLRVASAKEVLEDSELRTMVLSALKRIAVDVTEPAGVNPGITEIHDPVGTFEDHKTDILTLFEDKNSKDPMVSAAIALPTAIASLLRQIEVLRDGIQTTDLEDQSGLQAFKDSLSDVHAKVSELAPWATKVSELAQSKPETQAPKFPKMPKSVKPSPKLDEDKLPVIQPKEDVEPEQESEDVDSDLEELAAKL